MSDWSSVASAWRWWADLHRRCTRPVSDTMLRMGGLRPGFRVLDVACGVGEPAIEAGRRVAPGGCVIAIDASSEMVFLAREAARDAGITNVSFVVAGAEEPPRGPFDAALCRFGLMFFDDPVLALQAWKGEATPGAPVVAAVWAAPPLNPIGVARRKLLRKLFGIEATASSAPVLDDADALREVFSAAGLSDPIIEEVSVAWRVPDARTLATMISELNLEASRALAAAAPDRRDEFLEAFARELAAYPDGSVGFAVPGLSLVAAGRA